jgi:hypothetical protein
MPAVRRLHMAIAGTVFGATFAIGAILRGDVAPGLVGGALGAVLVYVVLLRVQEHNAAMRRRRERDEQ